ncbi:MAG: peptidase M16 [Lautropia sp. SCN 70-15]|nr:MAG: peptidase M16 [Lautropia sp. SCN 70-15]
MPHRIARPLVAVAMLALSPFLAAREPAPPASPPVVAAPAAASAESVAVTVERTLPNGMKVLVREDRRAPTVVHLVLYRIGAVDELNGLTGISHVLEHMMFKGTKTLAVGEFSRRVAERGGRENAFTSRDYTGYFQQIHRSHLTEMMKLEADRMANLVVEDQEFAREIKVVMEERRWRTEDRAQSLVYEQLMATAFTASPYRQPVVGWMSDLESMTAADIRDWYRRWYTPSNAILVVAGDVSADEVWKLAQETYGRIEASPMPERKPQREPEQRGVRRVSVKAPAENPYLMMGFKAPRLADVERDSEPYALEMLAAVLDADENGRLTRNLVRGSRVANQAGAGYGMTGRGPALFVLDGTPSEGQDTAALEKALRAEIARIAEEGVREDELQRIRAQYVAGQIYKRDSVMAQAMEIGGLEVSGYSHRDADRILERIRAVTAADIQAVARKYFDEDSLTVVTLLPQPIDPNAQRRPPPATRH